MCLSNTGPGSNDGTLLTSAIVDASQSRSQQALGAPPVVTWAWMLQACHPSLYLTSKERKLVTAAFGLAHWAAHGGGGGGGDGSGPSGSALLDAEATLGAACTNALRSRVLGPLTTALPAEAGAIVRGCTLTGDPHPYRGVEDLSPLLRLEYDVTPSGCSGRVFASSSAAISLRRAWARATLWPVTEQWALLRERHLLSTLFKV